MKKLLLLTIFVLLLSFVSFAQTNDEKAALILKKTVAKLGGDKYLAVKTSVGRGLLTTFRDGEKAGQSSFLDILVYQIKSEPNSNHKAKNRAGKFRRYGWIFEGGPQTIRDQSTQEIEGFSKSLRTSIDYLLRGKWTEMQS